MTHLKQGYTKPNSDLGNYVNLALKGEFDGHVPDLSSDVLVQSAWSRPFRDTMVRFMSHLFWFDTFWQLLHTHQRMALMIALEIQFGFAVGFRLRMLKLVGCRAMQGPSQPNMQDV